MSEIRLEIPMFRKGEFLNFYEHLYQFYNLHEFKNGCYGCYFR